MSQASGLSCTKPDCTNSL